MKKNFVLPVLAAVAAVTLVFTGCKDPEPVKVSSITVSPASDELEIGETVTLSAAVAPADAEDKTYTWSSSADAVATVSTSGVVTAVSEGTATITATANDGSNAKGTATITVNPVAPAEPAATITPGAGFAASGKTTVLYSGALDAEGNPAVDLSIGLGVVYNFGGIKLKLTTDNAMINGALAANELTEGFNLLALTPDQQTALGSLMPGLVPAEVPGKSLTLNFSGILPMIVGMIEGGISQFDIEVEVTDAVNQTVLDATPAPQNATATLKKTFEMTFVDDVTVWGTIAGDEFDIDEEQVINISTAATESRKINITSHTGIEKLLVNIDNPRIDAMLAQVGMTDGFPELDLATPGENATLLGMIASMGLTLPSGDAVKDKTELSIDMDAAFIGALVRLGEGTTAIELTNEDAAGHAVTKTLTITIVDDMTLEITGSIGDEPIVIKKSDATADPIAIDPVAVNVVADQGIKNFTVKIESTSATFMSLLAMQSIPTEFDLANAPEALAAVLTQMGLINPENPILDATEVQFDITAFIPAIFLAMEAAPAEDPGKTECTANFTITVKDGADQPKSATIALKLVDDTAAAETE